ncbi:MAG: rhodanese-like domain-containing protein [Pseudomonadota bacterium]
MISFGKSLTIRGVLRRRAVLSSLGAVLVSVTAGALGIGAHLAGVFPANATTSETLILVKGADDVTASTPPSGADHEPTSTTYLLSVVESSVRLRFSNVKPIDSQSLAVRFLNPERSAQISPSDDASANPDRPLVFDVREAAEFHVSHLPGAIRIDPAMSSAEFLRVYGDQLQKRSAVFYCSVGVRSAKFISRLVRAGLDRRRVENLEGGLFRWHNEQRHLVNASGPTDHIHGFNAYWGRLLTRRHLAVGVGKSVE